MHGEDQIASRDARSVQEAKKESDQTRIAVHEDDAIELAVRLGLCALAPVGDGTGDEDLPGREFADFGGGSDPFVRLDTPRRAVIWL
jgi:hypothetical protein